MINKIEFMVFFLINLYINVIMNATRSETTAGYTMDTLLTLDIPIFDNVSVKPVPRINETVTALIPDKKY